MKKNNVYITQYSYESGDSISTILDSKYLDGIFFNDYSFSEDEKNSMFYDCAKKAYSI